MFSLDQLTGSLLPYKTLCLTFDDGPGETPNDGPGPKTLRLAEYLHKENIPATFFCVGQHIDLYPSILIELDKLGHFIGHHTYSHPYMTSLFDTGQHQEILKEMSTTDELIRNLIPNKPIYFRAPYGHWYPNISRFLNLEFQQAINYKGPFFWDINADDYRFWQNHQSAAECAAAYLAVIENVNHGLFLMHDSTANIDDMRLNNLTFETLQILVPTLKEQGFSFVGIEKL
jgi:peptidoglycan/xylan/chitin deacetylase (PgdA/CDA1 family)